MEGEEKRRGGREIACNETARKIENKSNSRMVTIAPILRLAIERSLGSGSTRAFLGFGPPMRENSKKRVTRFLKSNTS